MIAFGKVQPGSTLYIPFETFASSTGAPITMTGLATSDIKVFKDGGATARASSSGFTLLDTDGTDFSSITGIHGFSIDLSDNTTADFWASGSKYFVVVSTVTVDSQTMSFVAATFQIGETGSILDTTIATLSSQTSFTLTAGPADNSALVGCVAVIHDAASAVQQCLGVVSAYTGSTKTVTLANDPGVFTMAAKDNISFMPSRSLKPTVDNRTLDVSAGGEAGVDWANVGSPTTTVDLSGTTIKTTQKVDVETIKTNPVVNSGTITFPTDATLASTTNITAGTVTTATNVTTVNGLAAGVITAAAVADGAIDRATFAADTGLQTIRSNTAQAGAAGTITLDASASATDDFYNDTTILLTGGTGVGQIRRIRDYVGSTKVATIVPNWATNPDNTSTFAILPATSAWDETLADHLDSGSTGTSLNAAGSAGDPWSTALPGAYGSGTAGHIVGTAIPDVAPGASGGLLKVGANTAAVSFTAGVTMSNASGAGLTLSSSGSNGAGLNVSGNGSGAGILATGGATGNGMSLVGGGTSGDALDATATNGHAFDLNAGGNNEGMHVQAGSGSDRDGIVGQGDGTAAGIAGYSGSGAGAAGILGFSNGTSGNSDGIRAAAGTGGVGIRATTITCTGAFTVGTNAIPWNASWDAEVQSEVDDALVAQRLDELLNADSDIDGAAPPTVGSVFHELMTKTTGSFTFDQTTDSLEALRDNTGTAGAGLTAVVWNAAWDAEVESEVSDALTAFGSSTLTAAGIRTAVGLASANLDTQLDALPTNAELATALGTADDAVLAAIAALNNLSAAQVNAEVVDALATDTYAEPGQGTPAATLSLAAKIGYLFKNWRNKKTQTGSQWSLLNDDALTVDQKATVSDDGTTASKTEVTTGP